MPQEGAKIRSLKDEPPKSVGAQYVTGDEWKNKERKNVDTEQYCIGIWNVRSINQSKLEVVK